MHIITIVDVLFSKSDVDQIVSILLPCFQICFRYQGTFPLFLQSSL